MISRLADRLTATEMKILARTVRDTPGPGPDRETEDLADPEGKQSKKERKKKSDRAAAAKNNPELTEQLAEGEITAEQLDQLADADRKTDGAASKDDSLMVKVRASNADQSRLLIRDFVNQYNAADRETCLLYTSPSPRDATLSRMPSSA